MLADGLSVAEPVNGPPVMLPGNARARAGALCLASLFATTMESRMTAITGYHAHVYYDAATREQARQLCEAAGKRFPLTVGRMHDNPVGPHPRGSCQLAFAPDQFAHVVSWLVANRKSLTVFAHDETGDALKDHTHHAIVLETSATV